MIEAAAPARTITQAFSWLPGPHGRVSLRIEAPVMLVESSQVVGNPSTISTGIALLGLPWLLGGHEYSGSIDNCFLGWIGDVRIVNHPLSVSEFMTGK